MLVNNSLKEEIKKVREFVIESYRVPDAMFSAYNTEIATNKGYNGRQILELFQNCDDVKSSRVLIKIDNKNRILEISNKGDESFTLEGYKSLFYPSLSSKTSGGPIGNKGLGFRSIVNWVETLEILSNDLCLTYSPTIIKKVFNDNTFFKSQSFREELLESRKLAENIVPLPLLSYPEIEEYDNTSGYTTTIRIKYKEGYYEDIVNQVKGINAETLLFLNHIEELVFEGFEGVENISVTSRTDNREVDGKTYQTIGIGVKIWDVIAIQGELPEQYQDKSTTNIDTYEVKIAFQNNLSDSINRMFSFFLTEDAFRFPFLVHGTFELDQNRKHLSNDKKENESSKNIFVLNKLSSLIIDTALNITVDKESKWKALRFIDYKPNIDNRIFSELNRSIINAVENEKLYPCFDGEFRKKDDVVSLGNSFAQMIRELSLEEFFPNHILEPDIVFGYTVYEWGIKKNVNNIQYLVEEISKRDFSARDRAYFIHEIIQKFPSTKFSFFINQNGDLIKGNDYIYTPSTRDIDLSSLRKEKELHLSDFRIEFIDYTLYNILLNLLLKGRDEKNKSRYFSDKFSKHCNIHSYEPATLAKKIISVYNNELNDSSKDKVGLIKEMNEYLFHLFTKIDDRSTKLTNDLKVYSINKNNEIELTKNLILSDRYKTGRIASDIFEGVYSDEDFVADPEVLFYTDDEDIDIDEIESYLKWLRVNSFAKYLKKEEDKRSDYIDLIKKNYDITLNNNNNVSYISIENLDTILSKISLEKLIIWINQDYILKRQINDVENLDKFKNKAKHKKDYISRYNVPSYIKYKIQESKRFELENHLIEDKGWINKVNIDYDYLKHQYQLSKIQVNDILNSLGAVYEFNDLSMNYLTSLFDKLNSLFPEGKGSQSFYTKVRKHYSQNKLELVSPVKLFATKRGTLGLYNQNEIYFSEKIKLPKSLIEDKPILNYPERQGGSEAIVFFKVNDLKKIGIKLNDYEINDELSKEFNAFLTSVKPIIFTYRLENLKKETVKSEEASKLNNLAITLCNSVNCSVEETSFDIENYTYFFKGNNEYLISIQEDKTLEEIKKEPLLSDTFADILSTVFNTTGESEHFMRILRDTEEFNKHYVEKYLGKDILDEAGVLLGKEDPKNIFWKSLYKVKNMNIDKLFKSDSISDIISVDFPYLNIGRINYSDINNKGNFESLRNIFSTLEIPLEEFNSISGLDINLFDVNKDRLGNFISKNEHSIKEYIWSNLKREEIGIKKKLLNEFKTIELLKGTILESEEEKLTFSFEINFDKLLIEYLNEEYEFGVEQLVIKNSFEYINQLEENKDKYTERELVLIGESMDMRSLMYFFFTEEINQIFNEYLEGYNKLKIFKSEESKSDKVKETIVVLIEDVDEIKTIRRKNISNRSRKLTNAFSGKGVDNSRLKEIGNRAEKVARRYIRETYGVKNMISRSEEDEGRQYDIKYSSNNGESWIYVEVKSFQHNKFFLSVDERDFGIGKGDDYEIWLVTNDDNIRILKDFYSKNPTLNPIEFVVIIDEKKLD